MFLWLTVHLEGVPEVRRTVPHLSELLYRVRDALLGSLFSLSITSRVDPSVDEHQQPNRYDADPGEHKF